MSENQKKIWITGASSGIGKAVAEKFAKEDEERVREIERQNEMERQQEAARRREIEQLKAMGMQMS